MASLCAGMDALTKSLPVARLPTSGSARSSSAPSSCGLRLSHSLRAPASQKQSSGRRESCRRPLCATASTRESGDSGAGPLLGALASGSQVMERQAAEADVMGLLLRQRIVFLGHQMDDFVADATISQLLLLDAQDPTKEIRLFVNCPGGSISAAMGIFDAIQMCRADVSTIAFGLAASTASIVLMGGTKGKRLSMPNARIMMHQPLGGASGKAIDVEIQAREIMYHKTNITNLIAQVTGKSFEQVEKDIDRDRYMSPVEAMEYGIIDGVIDKDMIIPLQPATSKIKPRAEYFASEQDPRKFLIPTIDDSEIY
eukprot:TRINITY_DN14432_c0_g2_i1.p1 TRINITY_DN14432_c0_g2~~TRINITY_DN14432_c0_g2_i1.p1  ORF type:complete len:313 (+),score=51.15 TRINITY_DN14432_c0_g2_i1:54-992(+)